MEDDILEVALAISFTRVPKFGKIIIWDDINDSILKDYLHSDDSVLCFVGVFVNGF